MSTSSTVAPHPASTTILILALLGWIPGVAIYAHWVANRARRDVDRGAFSEPPALTAGWIISILMLPVFAAELVFFLYVLVGNDLACIELGRTTLLLAAPFGGMSLLLALVAVAFKDSAFITSARRAQYLVAGSLTVAMVCLAFGFLSGNCYDVLFIYSHSDASTDIFFKIAGCWAGQTGSMLFWTWVMSMYGAGMAWSLRKVHDARVPWTLCVFAVIQVFFVLITAFLEQNPFDLIERSELLAVVAQRLQQAGGMTDSVTGSQVLEAIGASGWDRFIDDATRQSFITNTQGIYRIADVAPALLDSIHARGGGAMGGSVLVDGQGLNPLLMNHWIAIHPPCLYLGYIGFTVPFCFAIAGLISGQLDSDWIRQTRFFTLVPWFFLTIGNVLGGQWAYEELGWGGFWAWDPVENAAIIPWFISSAFIHSVMIQERRGMLKRWNMLLIIVTFWLTVVGTWITRSGYISSVHAFVGGTMIGEYLLVFSAIVLFGGLGLLFFRWSELSGAGRIESLLSREASFLFNNLILVLLAVVTLVLTLWPMITFKLLGQEAENTTNTYVINAVFFLLLFLLMGICPLIGWRKNTTGSFWRQIRKPAIVGAALFVLALWLQLSFTKLNFDRFLPGLQPIDTVFTTIRLFGPPLALGIGIFTLISLVLEFVAGTRARLAANKRIKADLGERATRPLVSDAQTSGDVSTTQRAGESPAPPGSSLQARANESVLVALWHTTFTNRRRYGGYIVHLGLVVMFIGIAGARSFQTHVTAHDVGINDHFTVETDMPLAQRYHLKFVKAEVGRRFRPEARFIAEAGEIVRDPSEFTADVYPQVSPAGETPTFYYDIVRGLDEGQGGTPRVFHFEGNARYFADPPVRVNRPIVNPFDPTGEPIGVAELAFGERVPNPKEFTYFYWRSWFELYVDKDPPHVDVPAYALNTDGTVRIATLDGARDVRFTTGEPLPALLARLEAELSAIDVLVYVRALGRPALTLEEYLHARSSSSQRYHVHGAPAALVAYRAIVPLEVPPTVSTSTLLRLGLTYDSVAKTLTWSAPRDPSIAIDWRALVAEGGAGANVSDEHAGGTPAAAGLIDVWTAARDLSQAMPWRTAIDSLRTQVRADLGGADAVVVFETRRIGREEILEIDHIDGSPPAQLNGVRVTGPEPDNVLRPSLRRYKGHGENVTMTNEVDIDRTLGNDRMLVQKNTPVVRNPFSGMAVPHDPRFPHAVEVNGPRGPMLVPLDVSTMSADFEMFVSPLLLWIWVGVAVVVIGALMAIIPSGQRRRGLAA